MSHIGRIAAGTLAKRGRRGGSSVSEFDIFIVVLLLLLLLLGQRSPWKFARARQLAAPKTAGVVLKKKKAADGGQTEKEKRKGKEKIVEVKMEGLSDSWCWDDLCGSTGPLYLSLQGQRAAVK